MRAIRNAVTCFFWGHKLPLYAAPFGQVYCRRCLQPIRYTWSTHR